METLSPIVVPVEAVKALDAWLMDQHYSSHARGRILAHVVAEGTPSGCPNLDREDEETATEVMIEAMPAICVCNPAWDEYAIEPHTGPRYYPTDATLRLLALDLVEDEPYEPTPEEDAEHTRWRAAREAEREAGRARLAADPGMLDIVLGDPLLKTIYADVLPVVPPISGGAPDAPYAPTAEDWADYAAEQERLDALDVARHLERRVIDRDEPWHW